MLHGAAECYMEQLDKQLVEATFETLKYPFVRSGVTDGSKVRAGRVVPFQPLLNSKPS
jgi:hypothetical protein